MITCTTCGDPAVPMTTLGPLHMHSTVCTTDNHVQNTHLALWAHLTNFGPNEVLSCSLCSIIHWRFRSNPEQPAGPLLT